MPCRVVRGVRHVRAAGAGEATGILHDVGTLQEAQAARDAGALWRARDLLVARVEEHRDPEALRVLAEVLGEMGDLPRAGAVWFAAGARGPEVDTAVAAWREQCGDDFVAMWWSLPPSVRAAPRPRRVEALRERALAADPDLLTAESAEGSQDPADSPLGAGDRDPAPEEKEGDDAAEQKEGFDAAWLVAWVLAAVFVVFAVIGFVTALGWIVPG